ncbi:helix-turn-helix domain-containing protein [Fructilactobacillus sp. Tb1]|uniref:helix-turn-helix domain-containing protein n=1 Tax=Fructilactobacillus sp. Tb1 TaxID=3422304 RepID=UPI003D2B7558
MTTFERIKEISKKRGLSLRKVSEKAGLSENVIYSWKRKVPSTRSLEKVSKVLGVTLNDLINNTEIDISKEDNKSVDLDDEELLMSFDGQPIPDADRELIVSMLRQLKNGRENNK